MSTEIRELTVGELDVVTGGFAPLDAIKAAWNNIQNGSGSGSGSGPYTGPLLGPNGDGTLGGAGSGSPTAGSGSVPVPCGTNHNNVRY